METPPFNHFLTSVLARGGFETVDVLAAMLPLMREVQALHETNLVAPLRGVVAIVVREDRELGLPPDAGVPGLRNPARLRELEPPVTRGLEVIGEALRETDLNAFSQHVANLDLGCHGQEITRPVYLPGYVGWEHTVDHHDALTDIHSLGLLLASLACGLDFTDPDDLALFVSSRGNLFALASRLHPVVARVIVEMTELQRAKRAQDLPSLIRRLETYREQPVEMDLGGLPGVRQGSRQDQRSVIQTHLRDRLFEISRRNKLLYFKSTQSTINLTVASVPLVLDYRNVRPEELLYWHPSLARELAAGKALPLNRWLRMEEAPYLPGQLDKLISEARRDRAEYGFSQLRLVLVFLRWHNLKEAPDERIHSPLLLMPVELTKKKGVKDHYTLEPTDSEVEVNPALRHHLKQLYNLELPPTIDLRTTTLAEFHEQLKARIQASEPGVNLSLTEKPRIQLIHERAQQRVDQYRRRMARTGRPLRAATLDYSYDRNDFRPLGLQIYHQHVAPAPLPLRDLAGAPPVPRTPHIMDPGGPVIERKSFALVEDGMGNPYAWEMDLCALTLANFNYRRMTLVRDYAQLLDGSQASTAFDQVFSLEPRALGNPAIELPPPSGQHLIIAADATQVGAIARARTGESLIIQGPPGTGKSQTITNLIADFVARGKRVLFVCEKRAAIDVVFHRLRQQGLDELCCLIHDSQTDKKEFILNLKQTYEKWLAFDGSDPHSEAKRHSALKTLDAELAALDGFRQQLTATPVEAGVPLAGLLQRLIELRGTPGDTADPELTAVEEEALPHYQEWCQAGDSIRRLADGLQDLGAPPVFAWHPLCALGDAIIRSEAPMESLATRLDGLEQRLAELDKALQQTGLPLEHWKTLEEVAQWLDSATRLLPLARKGLLGLLDSKSPATAEFLKLCASDTKLRKVLAAAQEKTVYWIEKLPPDETASALEIARQATGLTAWLKPSWWRLRKVLGRCYDFSRHAVRPSWQKVLQDLADEHQAAAAVAAVSARCEQDYTGPDPAALRRQLAELSAKGASASAVALRGCLLGHPHGPQLVETLAALAADCAQLRAAADELLFAPEQHDLGTLLGNVRGIRKAQDVLPELLPALRELAAAPVRLAHAARTLPLTADQLESACARKTLTGVYRGDRAFERFDGHLLKQKLDRIAKAHRQWLEQNADWIRFQAKWRFIRNAQIANQPASVLDPAAKLFKKAFTAGRRELEHEFGKTMRYKSIRDLAAGDSGQVIRDLKPIWLMSPLSVSDTLPLDAACFDVVIFDEASQIPVEEAVPAVYRAQQVIVVGDEMQLPPTSFFSPTSGDEDELTLEDEGERVSVLMDAASFLAQSARNLPSTLLAWHYRSRYEALISFSNAAFYGGALFTIPDRQISHRDAAATRVSSPADADALSAAILTRPISFVHCEGMPYENRRNPGEAAVIARLVRGFLTGGTRLSLGIAAFSEAQQGEIEGALDSLAASDPAFGILLEAEYVREEDDQFCGLFVKNLENIQGDERDIILMSVCYGRDASGRLRMNFGPINQRGGEKRLNVIFSRARHHMAIVSSLRYTDITNDYNDGANTLKNFLHYAECLGRGDAAGSRQVLDGLNPLNRKALQHERAAGVIARQLCDVLLARGWAAECHVGQSRFRCEVAVRAAGGSHHQLAILLDVTGGAGVLERCHTQPAILEAFGWVVLIVLAKDWWHEPQAVIERIERLLQPQIP